MTPLAKACLWSSIKVKDQKSTVNDLRELGYKDTTVNALIDRELIEHFMEDGMSYFRPTDKGWREIKILFIKGES